MEQLTRRQLAITTLTGLVASLFRPTMARADDALPLAIGTHQGTVWSASQLAFGVPLVARLVGKDRRRFAGKLGAEVYDAPSLTWKRLVQPARDNRLAVQPPPNSAIRFYLDTHEEVTVGIAVEPR